MTMPDVLDFPDMNDARSQLQLGGRHEPAGMSYGAALLTMLPLEGRKDDGAKNRLDLLPFAALEEVGKVLTHGAGKYAPDNWRKGMAWRRLIGAALRHVFAFAKGENLDPETGLSHLAHAICCLGFLLTYHLESIGSDDRVHESNRRSSDNGGKP